jgi:hypothetical protein
MAGWTDSSPTSRIFIQAILNPITESTQGTTNKPLPTTYSTTGGILSDTINVALFNNTVSPDASAAVGSTGYNTGTWTTGNEITDVTNWVAGGRALASKTFSVLTAGSQTTPSAVNFDAADLAGGGNVTLIATFGCLVYDLTITAGTVAKQGLCFNYFGGTQSVTAGTFTIIWDATGVFKITN